MVREARKDDLQALLHLYLDLHETHVPASSPALQDTWTAMLRDPNHHVLLCEIGGALVASCVCVVIPNLTRDVRPYAPIENVVTRADCRGKGYATACLDRAREIARQCNCYKIMLLTGSRQPETLHFYEHAGYNRADKTAFVQWLD